MCIRLTAEIDVVSVRNTLRERQHHFKYLAGRLRLSGLRGCLRWDAGAVQQQVRGVFAFSDLPAVLRGVPLDGVPLIVGQYFPDTTFVRVFPHPSGDRGNEPSRKVAAHTV